MTPGQKTSAWLQYLYFLRFSILFWLFLPILVLLDRGGYTTTLTRAFMAPNSFWQAFHIAFFTTSMHMVVLITARNFCMNGAERFQTEPPATLKWFFNSSQPAAVWLSLALAHIPTAITLAYVAHISKIEGEENFAFFGRHSHVFIWVYFAIGIVLALFFWYAVSLFYYWTYTEPIKDTEPTKETEPTNENLDTTATKPLIFPHSFFGDLDRAPRPALATFLELPLRLVLRFTYHGFAPTPKGPLWELHFLSFVSLIGFLLLYLFLYPLTAPVPRADDLFIGAVVASVIALLFILGIVRTPTRGHSKWCGRVKFFFIAVAVGLVLIFCLSAHQFLTMASGVERRLPVLATILIIASFSLWVFAGLAFLLDRYRIPVLTTFLVIIFLPKLLQWTYGEHYFLAADRVNTSVIPPSPAQAINLRTQDPSDPLIIITATGGGIHAAAWTTEVLGRLEESFANDPSLQSPVPGAPHYNFHDHVLLASGVSGGSVGLMSYLLEYSAPKPFDPSPLSTVRMTNAAACSSIEDVAWGLEYYDLFRLLTNVWFSRPGHPQSDRNWALTKAFNRNLNDPRCRIPKDQHLPLDGESLTLGKAAELLKARQLPAFTLNTTAAETGGRFLLSNYQLPRSYSPDSDLLPAESYLHAYGEPCEGSDHKDYAHHKDYAYADLPIATAARLSATFPLVSSASRVPAAYARFAYHFVDGGYYDNDGTASAIEFLNSALARPAPNVDQDPCLKSEPAPSPVQAQASPVQAKASAKSTKTTPQQGTATPRTPPPLAILLIEIRNGDDLDPLSNEDDYNFQTNPENPHDWTAISQFIAPAGALWKAGHESVTRRNRLGLCLLESTYLGGLVIHHVVFNFDPAPPTPQLRKRKDVIQPLNWHLTTGERKHIHDEAYDIPEPGSPVNGNTAAAIDDAKQWVHTILNRASATTPRPPVESDKQEACRIAYVRAKPQTAAETKAAETKAATRSQPQGAK